MATSARYLASAIAHETDSLPHQENRTKYMRNDPIEKECYGGPNEVNNETATGSSRNNKADIGVQLGNHSFFETV